MKALNKLFVVAVFLFLGVSAFAWDLGLYGPATPIDERAPRAEGVLEVPLMVLKSEFVFN